VVYLQSNAYQADRILVVARLDARVAEARAAAAKRRQNRGPRWQDAVVGPRVHNCRIGGSYPVGSVVAQGLQ
jgi:hypothetical protein